MSITAGYIILAVILLRLLIKKAPKWIHCLLWSIAGIRLLIPFSIKSIFSLIPRSEAVSTDILQTYIPGINNSSIINQTTTEMSVIESTGAVSIQNLINTASVIWIVGMAALLIYGIISYIILHNKVDGSESLSRNVYICNSIESPFILGIIKPRIYLPYNIDNKNIPHVIAHEEAHLKRKDHWIKPLSFLLLCVYWFNPLVWVAYILLSRDVELACDEAVIRKVGVTQKKAYSEALLACSIGRKTIAACPLAFGEVGVKGRIRNVLNYKKPAFWIILISILLCFVLALVLLTNPKDDKISELSAVAFPEDTYAFEECLYINPLSSYIPFEDTGELYKITRNNFAIINKESGETNTEIAIDNVHSSSFTDEEWADLFIFDMFIEDIRELNYKERTMWKLSDDYRIYKMDDEIWLMRLSGKNGVWSIYKLIPEEMVVDASNAVNLEYWNSTANLDNVDSLDKIIPNAIFAANKDNFKTGEIATEAYTILKKEENQKEIVLYIMAMYMEFNYSNGNLIESSGTHSPIVITLEKGDNGGYGLEEYWIPDDGAGYLASLRNKFPDNFKEELWDTQNFVTEHIRVCYESAIIQSGMEVNARIAELIDIICSSPSYSSNFNDYIKAHENEYTELLNYGTYTLTYCFDLFNEGNQTGLHGHIMASACREILMGTDLSDSGLTYTTGQEWYDEFHEIVN